jgi:hypothetical protein
MISAREVLRRPLWLARAGASLGGLVLVALAAAYWLTYEPAPQIGITWRPGISDERRAELERRFLLVNPARENDRLMYDLLDTRRSNIEALVFEPDVADTDRISRPRYEVPFDVPYGQSWMWVAHRTPLLRMPGAVETMTGVAIVLLVAGLVAMTRSRRGAGVRRLESRERIP